MNLNRRSFLASSGAALTGAAPGNAAAPGSGPAELHVAACQILTFPDTKKSAEKVCAWLETAAQKQVDVVLFPEACLCGYTCDPEYWKTANPADFQAAEEKVIAAARRLNLAAVVGTAHWEDGKVRDSVLVIDKGGQVRGRYSKTFLAEKWPTPGHTLPVWTVAGVKSCFIICHDVRYPELVRLPAVAGAQICYFSSNESGLLEEHKLSAYHAMPVSRATENSIYLVMANAPADAKNMYSQSQSHGNSKIIHPDGNVLTEAGYFKETLVSAVIDLKPANRSIAKRAANEHGPVSNWLREGSKLVEGDLS